MNAANIIVASAIASIAYAIWVRRHTLTSHIERPLTLSVILCVVGVVLISPTATNTVGGLMHSLTRMWHVDTMLGDLCLLASQASALTALLAGVFTDEQRSAWLRVWVQPVITVAMPSMVACHIFTRALGEGTADILDVKPDGWLTGYWVLMGSVAVYLWLAGLRVLRIMRDDRRSRRLANAYIGAMGCGVLAGAIQIIRTVTGLEPFGGGLIVWLLVCTAYAGTCMVAAWSWRLKELRLRGHRPALR